MHNTTVLPDKRIYETFDNPSDRNIRYNQLKTQGKKPEQGQYESAN